jgi:hypothetical protein
LDGHAVAIEDYLSGRSYRLDRQKKTAAWIQLAGNEPFVEDRALFEVSPVSHGGTTLGEKEIEGRRCTGWSLSGTDYWFDKGNDMMVIVEKESKKAPGHKYWIGRLIKYSSDPMPPECFMVPSDYKVHYGLI